MMNEETIYYRYEEPWRLHRDLSGRIYKFTKILMVIIVAHILTAMNGFMMDLH